MPTEFSPTKTDIARALKEAAMSELRYGLNVARCSNPDSAEDFCSRRDGTMLLRLVDPLFFPPGGENHRYINAVPMPLASKGQPPSVEEMAKLVRDVIEPCKRLDESANQFVKVMLYWRPGQLDLLHGIDTTDEYTTYFDWEDVEAYHSCGPMTHMQE
jgi:hypothetical protein